MRTGSGKDLCHIFWHRVVPSGKERRGFRHAEKRQRSARADAKSDVSAFAARSAKGSNICKKLLACMNVSYRFLHGEDYLFAADGMN